MNKNSSSKYIGVYYRIQTNKWIAYIKKIHLGTFENEIDATKSRGRYINVTHYYTKNVKLCENL